MAMKQELKRIETTLHHLTGQSPQPQRPAPVHAVRPLSFEVKPTTQPSSKAARPTADQLAATPLNLAEIGANPELRLPTVNAPGFTSHRNAANPALAMNLLQEMQTIVTGWQAELQQVLKQVQDIYLEGPIVNGWLEAYAQETASDRTLRHAELDCLMNYVEQTWKPIAPIAATTQPSLIELPPSGYRLCGLNEDGQLWFRHCPAEQVAAVSMAIARYQRLSQLLTCKQTLEARLSQLAETLIVMHGQLSQVS